MPSAQIGPRRGGSPLEAVLFDFAGTLFMPRPAIDLLGHAAQALGVALTEAESARLAAEYLDAGLPGGPYPDAVPGALKSLYEQRDLSPAQHRAAYLGLLGTVAQPHPGLTEAVYEELLRPRGWMAYADALEVIGELRARDIGVGLISNIGFDLRPILRRHGFAELAPTCTLSFEEQMTKPDPRIFVTALRRLGAGAAQTLMVGDHATADGGATALGMSLLLLPMTPAGGEHGLERVLAVVDRSRR